MSNRVERKVQEVLETVPSEELDEFRRVWAKRITDTRLRPGSPPRTPTSSIAASSTGSQSAKQLTPWESRPGTWVPC
jgi:hypothetical protein